MKRLFVAAALAAFACGGPPSAESPEPIATATPTTTPQSGDLGPPDRSKLPEPAPTPKWALPPANTSTLANGMRVYHLEQGKTPLVSVLLVLPRGSATDPDGKAGLTDMTADMLDEGAGKLGALELSEELQRLGTDYHAGADVDNVTFAMNTITDSYAESVKLLADIVRRPTLSAQEFLRRRDQRVASTLSAEDSPGHGRAVVMRQALFGDGYGAQLPDGNPDTLKRITLADIKRHYLGLVVPEGAAFVVVGGIDANAAKKALEEQFGDWSGKATVKARAISDKKPQSSIYFVNYKGTSQSAIAVARRSEGMSSDEYFPALVFNRAFGQAFTSRLNLNLREDKGYTYGARSTYQRWPEHGFFALVASVKAETTRASIDEMLKELDDVCGPRPLAAKERDEAVGGLLLGFPGRFETGSATAAQLADLPLYGKPNDWFQKWPGRVSAIDVAAANAAAKKYCDKKDFVIAVAGDQKSVEPTLEGLELPVLHFDARGKKLPR